MSYKNILIWEPNWIGDVIFTTPFIRAVRQRYPESRIVCVSAPRCREILEVNPNVNEVLLYDEKTINRGIADKFEIISEIRKRKIDLAILLHRSFTRGLFCFLGGARQRVGYAYKKRNFILTGLLKSSTPEMHRIEYYMNLAKKIGADPRSNELEFYTTADDDAYADNLLKMNGVTASDRLIALNPGGNWGPKRWPAENFALLASALMKRYGVKVIVTGGDSDIDLYLNIQDMSRERLSSSCGKTTIRQLGALFKRCELVISGDSGPLHIALALRKKVIAIFGPTSPELTGPYGAGEYTVLRRDTGCRVPCYDSACLDHRCMKAVTVDHVLESAGKLLGKT